MIGISFNYDATGCIIMNKEDSVGIFSEVVTLEDLEKLKSNIESAISEYKSESAKMFKDGDYVVDDVHNKIFIFNKYSYDHCGYNCPSSTVQINYHCLAKSDGSMTDNFSFVSDANVAYRKADPEEVAYLDYRLKKKGFYFDKKDKKLKRL